MLKGSCASAGLSGQPDGGGGPARADPATPADDCSRSFPSRSARCATAGHPRRPHGASRRAARSARADDTLVAGHRIEQLAQYHKGVTRLGRRRHQAIRRHRHGVGLRHGLSGHRRSMSCPCSTATRPRRRWSAWRSLSSPATEPDARDPAGGRRRVQARVGGPGHHAHATSSASSSTRRAGRWSAATGCCSARPPTPPSAAAPASWATRRRSARHRSPAPSSRPIRSGRR